NFVCVDGVCFFFQAEDGIRDFHVTGVQTCALPISSLRLLIPTRKFSGLPVAPRTKVPLPWRATRIPSRSHRRTTFLTVPSLIPIDRKSTRLNSSHVKISYAVFCLKKKNKNSRYTPQ